MEAGGASRGACRALPWHSALASQPTLGCLPEEDRLGLGVLLELDDARALYLVADGKGLVCRAKTDKRREVPPELLERVRTLSSGFAKAPDMSRMSYHRCRRFS